MKNNELVKKQYVILDIKEGNKFPFYDFSSNSFFMLLPFATVFQTLERAEKILKRIEKNHPDKILQIKDIAEL